MPHHVTLQVLSLGDIQFCGANGHPGQGGAGYYGGGGGGSVYTYCGAGGGGGSSWADPSVTTVTILMVYRFKAMRRVVVQAWW